MPVKIEDEAVGIVQEYGIILKTRDIWIGNTIYPAQEEEEITHVVAANVIKNLHLLRHSNTKPVTIHLHTCGGITIEGMAIYDTIKLMPYKTTIISYTHARSMSSIIFLAADKKYMLPHSYFMFHMGTIAIDGDCKTVYSNIEFYKKQDIMINNIYIDHLYKVGKLKKTKKAISKYIYDLMDRKGDVYLTAQEAVKWGFADDIIHGF